MLRDTPFDDRSPSPQGRFARVVAAKHLPGMGSDRCGHPPGQGHA